jgi:hypothetical protein
MNPIMIIIIGDWHAFGALEFIPSETITWSIHPVAILYILAPLTVTFISEAVVFITIP